jgi:FkbM family methyltransferase
LIEHGPIRVKRCRHGVMAYPITDAYIGRSLDRYGKFSEAEMRLLEPLVREGDTVLDVGAHVGTHTVFLAGCVGAAGLVLAFEPQRPLFEMLCANVALNGLWQTHPHHAAVGGVRGSVIVPEFDLDRPTNFGGLSLAGRSGASEMSNDRESVSMLRIDDLALEGVALVKIDVEGMEAEVLEGAAETIARFRPVLYVENDREEKSNDLLRRLLDLDYRLFWHLPPLYNPDNFFGEPENVFGALISANVLALPRSGDVGPPNGLPEITISNGVPRPSLQSLFEQT